MKKWSLIFAACVLLLAGCAHFDRYSCRQCAIEGFDPRVVRPPNPLLPNVFVVRSGYLVVDQEPIRISRRDAGPDGRVTIAWALAAGSPYTFSTTQKKRREGIEFSPADQPSGRGTPVNLVCGMQGSQEKVYQCSFTVPEGRFKYKYTVYVLNGDQLLSLDPSVEGDH